MSVAHAQKFYEIVARDQALFQKLVDGTKTPDEFLDRTVAEAKRQGLEFSPQEADEVLAAQSTKWAGELSDQQLEAVAGGKGSAKGGIGSAAYWQQHYGTIFGKSW